VIGKMTLRSIISHKWRVALATIAVVVGVAFVSGAFILTDSFQKAFDGLFKELNAGIDYHVRGSVEFGTEGSGDPVPAELADKLAGIDGVAVVEPALQSDAMTLIDDEGDPVRAAGGPSLGVSWTGEGGIGGTTIRDGRAPNGPDEVAIDAATAKRVGFEVDQQVEISGPTGLNTYTLVGTAGVGDDESFFGAVVMLFDPQTAQTVFDSAGLYDAIDIAVADGADSTAVRSAIEQVLPSGTEVITGKQFAEETSDQISQITTILRWVLLGFAIIALFVSAFLINNTFQIIVNQRVRELALMRAVGASGSQVRSMVMLESLFVAAVATVLGFLGGIGVAKLLTVVFNASGAGFPDAATVIALRTLLVAMLVGFGVTLAASVLPAVRASRIAPVAAMRPELVPLSGSGPRRRNIGLGLTVVGIAAFLIGVLGQPSSIAMNMIIMGSGVVALFIGVTMLAASFASPVARALGAPIRMIFKVPGQLATENAARTPRRTSSTSAALMIGVALVSGIGVLGASLKKSLVEQLRTSITADFYMRDPSFSPFPDTVVERLSALPELDGVSGFKFGRQAFKVGESTKDVGAVDTATFDRLIDMDVTAGGYEGMADAGLMLFTDEAEKRDLQVGDTLDVTWRNGTTQTLTVRGLFDDASVTQTQWVVDNAVYEAANPSETADFFAAARITEGVDPDTARTAILGVVEEFPQLLVQDRVEFRKSQEDQLNQILFLIYGLLGFAVVIAVLGIMNTLALSVFERTREFGLLRAVGSSRKQLRRAIRGEAIIVAVFGALLGLAVGLPLGIIGNEALKGIPISGVTETAVPVGTIIAIVVLSVLAGLLAAWWPGRRAAKLDILEAIATE
jgi:putative ABC transport system permease protein